MSMKYLLGLYQAAVAVAVLVFFSFSHVYRLVLPVDIGAGTVWWYLDILMLLALLIGLVASFQRKRALDADGEQGLTREYFEANLLFWATIVAIFWFIRSWLAFLLDLDNDYAWWTEIDTVVILVLYPCGRYLMRQAKGE